MAAIIALLVGIWTTGDPTGAFVDVLALDEDGTFTITSTYADTQETAYAGTWSVENDSLWWWRTCPASASTG